MSVRSCDLCGVSGPERSTAMADRAAAKEAGWSRCYSRGWGEEWRCPTCRSKNPPGMRLPPGYFVVADNQAVSNGVKCDITLKSDHGWVHLRPVGEA